MWRVAVVALILAAGCAGGHEQRKPDDSWVFGPSAHDPQPVKAHESAGEKAEDITGGIIQGIFDVSTGGGN